MVFPGKVFRYPRGDQAVSAGRAGGTAIDAIGGSFTMTDAATRSGRRRPDQLRLTARTGARSRRIERTGVSVPTLACSGTRPAGRWWPGHFLLL